MGLFFKLGQYYILMAKVFSKPEKKLLFFKQTLKEIEKIGLNSISIVLIISVFIGGVITLQMAYNIENPLFPSYTISLSTRDTILLEFSSTIIALILAGKVGSSISSEIGTMRITEQIDALEIMGVNSANFLILPKITAAVIFNPFLTLLSMIVGIFGGWAVGISAGVTTSASYIMGLQYSFVPYYITYALIKTAVFAFIITSISAYCGYYAQGSSLEVGKSSTQGVVYSSVCILMFNLILTKLLLS